MATSQYNPRLSNNNTALKMAYKGLAASLIGMLVMACSGCGGGGGGGSPSTPASVKAAPAPVIIDAQGDSTMYTICEMPDASYVQCNPTVPQILQTALQASFGSTVTVINNGVPGTTITWRMDGVKPYTQPYTQYLHTDPAQIVIANWAINDGVKGIGEPVETYQQFLVDFVTLTRAVGKIPVLEEPGPTAYPPAELPYVQAMDYVATQMNVPLVKQFDYIQSLPNWRSMIQADNVHPNLQMYQIKAQREAEVLAPIVKSIQGS